MYEYFVSGHYISKSGASGFNSAIMRLEERMESDGMLEDVSKALYTNFSEKNNLGPGNEVILNFIYLGMTDSIKA